LFNTKVLTYSGIGIALAVVLNQLAVFSFPNGGAITLGSMFFITILGYWFGVKVGVIAGVSMGLINLALGGFVFAPVQVLLDYPLAFGMLGLSGLFKSLHVGYIVAVVGRFVMHTISGVVFFYMFAPEEQNVWVFSMVYNASYIAPEMLLTVGLISVPAFRKALDRIKGEM